MMKTYQVDTELAQPLCYPGGIGLAREIRAKSKIHSKEPHSFVIGGIRYKIGANTMKSPVTDEKLIGLFEWAIQEAEIRSTGKLVLIDTELKKGILSKARNWQQNQEDFEPQAHG